MTRVLVTEDSVVARALLVSILNRDPGLEVVGEARDGEQAVKLAAELDPDVITMDVHMPKVDGLEATRRIMGDTPKPIVVISALDPSDVKLSVEALQTGALAVLAKPSGPMAPDFNERAAEIVRTVSTMAGVRVEAGDILLVRTGIHRSLSESELLSLCAACGGMPDFLAAAFTW